MSQFVEFVVERGFVMDAFGVIGLGLLGLAAVRLSQRYRSWGGSLLACGALLLLLGRLWVLALPHLLASPVRNDLGPTLVEIVSLAPFALLTAGLAGVVWGLWGHEQWLRSER
ncbi:hypothetical protein OJ996_00105 [Luteolibacter sp. GHJ8]|jgi:hypothetical protein|uniref:Uncharacterized protein n=1 Tax=Luteolibacter rhizosphaerae TaxID=2989719 RepID=A0ABT3FXH4_9BACT|nr:hypothetical protein [Luteolibacter rhizosphaerae]MCW1911954.1 hypothetical protein [Luteolibacter rhizosphaerae]